MPDKEMDKYTETFRTWNKVAPQYQDKFMDVALYNDTYDFFCGSFSKEHPKILEIGCGPGNMTKYLLSKRPDFQIYGIDVAPQMIELARANNPSADFAVMDARQIKDLTTTYDGIISGFCLPYLSRSDVRDLIHHCRSLLHDDGMIYLSFVEGELAKAEFQSGSDGDRVYFYYHSLEDIKKQLALADFNLVKSFRVEYKKERTEKEIHRVLVANKKKNQL